MGAGMGATEAVGTMEAGAGKGAIVAGGADAAGSPRPVALRVSVPATSANLGVGFDCLGVALDLRAAFTMRGAKELRVTGCEERFRGRDNLVWTTYLDTCATLGVRPEPLEIDIDSPVPLSGGLGSSSTCVVAGVMAALERAGRSDDLELALDLATKAEGHPDNVAPAVLGGLVSSFVKGEVTTSTRMDVAEGVRLVAIAPPYEVRTADARQVLPKRVTLETCVWQVGRAVACVRALETGDLELMAKACEDRLHEPYRKRLIPDYDALRAAALEAGAAAFVISGSGSTMLAVCNGDEVAARVAERANGVREGLWVRAMGASAEGVVVERLP